MKFKELEIIEKAYGDRIAHRSQVPLINHIHEGIAILLAVQASEAAIRAFCIHPIVQTDMQGIDLSEVSPDVLILAEEYRDRANAYLCRPETDYIDSFVKVYERVNQDGEMSRDCAMMLYADKIQNQKDFRLYHKETHPRSEQLDAYFNNWITYLRAEYDI